MTTQLHNTGEEWLLDSSFGGGTSSTQVKVGLYNDGSDGLSDSDDVDAITTEPTGSKYNRQSASLGSDFTNQKTSGNWEALIADQTYDTSDSSQSVDSYFVVVNFTSDDAGDGSATDHLLFTGALTQTYDLGSVDTFTLGEAGISVT